MTHKTLQREFDSLNERFFGGRIMLRWVGFSNKTLPRHASGAYYNNRKWILIDSGLKAYHNITSVVLLHEMVHADLDLRGYKGYPYDGGHGMLFQVELDRLYKCGAFDGLL